MTLLWGEVGSPGFNWFSLSSHRLWPLREALPSPYTQMGGRPLRCMEHKPSKCLEKTGQKTHFTEKAHPCLCRMRGGWNALAFFWQLVALHDYWCHLICSETLSQEHYRQLPAPQVPPNNIWVETFHGIVTRECI